MVTPLDEEKKTLAKLQQQVSELLAKEGGQKIGLIEKVPKGGEPLFNAGELLSKEDFGKLVSSNTGFSIEQEKKKQMR